MAPSVSYQLEKSVASINGLKASNEENESSIWISHFLCQQEWAAAVKPGHICNSHIWISHIRISLIWNTQIWISPIWISHVWISHIWISHFLRQEAGAVKPERICNSHIRLFHSARLLRRQSPLSGFAFIFCSTSNSPTIYILPVALSEKRLSGS